MGESLKRYEALAHDLAESIRCGVLRAGEKLPSVREASARRGVSASTVFQAYYLLEAQGLIRARDRSGYYVVHGTATMPPEPEPPVHIDPDSNVVDVSSQVFEMLESIRQREVVPFGSAFPDPALFPMAKLGQVMASTIRQLDPWQAVDDLSPGNAQLRRQIALRYQVDGMAVTPDDIVITNGALEALNLCLGAVTRPGDTVIVESPTFYAALQSLERLGLRAIEVPAHPREGIDLAALARALAQHQPAACWLMTSFQNPLGSLMPEPKKRELVALLARHGVPLIEDDVYAELYFGANRPAPAKAFDTQGLVMHCGSFSKSLAPGYRVGWAVPGRFFRAVARHKLSTSLSTSMPAQAAIAAYLERGGYDRHLRALRHELSVRQGQMMAAVGARFPAGARATRPAGGYFLWVELPGEIDTRMLHRQALAAGISIAPGPMFSSHPRFLNCLRLNYGHAWDMRAEAAFARLGGLIHAMC
ncbi:PLP-dependent aminotransferase family protein [Pigmentiphaga aceris]|uniref:PLP-dependent aminotransferase family protein n=1 Tax=Pigmentiphaga aceris TaxID=1940612 RepID=A0A5C0ASY8_9BURK|nr:PLP-dependent aminotransferase family protein [Pigmentiphaga aceris]QEI05429.1 PLP-dependent aminotransferase family protein [Pigmentiphaga aceris]